MGRAAGPEKCHGMGAEKGLYIDNHEDRRPHGLQDYCEHLQTRSGRDAEESDGEHEHVLF